MLTPQNLTADLALLENWEDKYAYIIDLGRDLPPMPEADKTDTNRVPGCTSQVWLTHKLEKSGAGDKHIFTVDSDAHIVKGLLAILMVLYNGKTSAEIQQQDATAFLTQIGMAEHLSPNRRSGFAAVNQKIHTFAA